ncbi:hypothetical protein H206_03458 [Candidatus Electrothrix aarhusensis]|uniref:Uncharacterized protein n=1 Tax=Candidatus Electrothrix aarhusensis TaxID=1859131 RepID=A0A3S3QUK2_9BACT|nr:hypothetical protein H206_03458 [Candidatus Electrothrix aarhusensis]
MSTQRRYFRTSGDVDSANRVGADLCVRPICTTTEVVPGQTHRSAPTLFYNGCRGGPVVARCASHTAIDEF